MISNHAPYRLSAAIFLTASVIFFFMMDAVGLYHDDFLYRIYFPATNQLDWLGGSRHNETLTDAFVSYTNHYNLWDNARIANLLAFIFGLMPNYIADIVSTVCFIVVFFYALKLSSHDKWWKTPIVAALLYILWYLLLPLRGSMLSTVHIQNYLWSSAIILPYIGAILTDKTCKSKTGFALLIAYGCIAGIMHEGFVAEWGFGLVVWWIVSFFKKQKLSGRQTTLIAVFLLASLYLLTSPATNSRIAEQVSFPDHLVPTIAYALLYDFRYLPILAAILTLFIAKRGVSALLSDGITLTFTASALISLVLSIITQQQSGVAWPGALGAIIVILRLTSPYISRIRHSNAIAAAIAVGCTAWLLLIIDRQYDNTEKNNLLAREIAGTSDNIIYLDMPTGKDSPWWADGKLITLIDRDIPYVLFTNYHLGGTSKRHGDIYTPIAVFPSKYRNFPLDSLPAINGSANLRGIYPFYIGPIVNDSVILPIRITFSTKAYPDRNSSPIIHLLNSLRYTSDSTTTKPSIAIQRKMVTEKGDTTGLFSPFIPFMYSDYPILAIDHNFGADR